MRMNDGERGTTPPPLPFAGQKSWSTAFAMKPLHNSEGDIQLDLTNAQTKSKMVDIGIDEEKSTDLAVHAQASWKNVRFFPLGRFNKS